MLLDDIETDKGRASQVFALDNSTVYTYMHAYIHVHTLTLLDDIETDKGMASQVFALDNSAVSSHTEETHGSCCSHLVGSALSRTHELQCVCVCMYVCMYSMRVCVCHAVYTWLMLHVYVRQHFHGSMNCIVYVCM
jgi:hypothetical protein